MGMPFAPFQLSWASTHCVIFCRGLGVPKLVVLNMAVCKFYAEALFCALLRPFALLRSFADLRLRSFAVTNDLRSFAGIFECFCFRPRLERPRLGTAEGAVKIAAATAENRAVLVHSAPKPQPNSGHPERPESNMSRTRQPIPI